MTRIVFDYSKLRGLIKERSMTLTDYASSIGISMTTLYERLTNKTPFSQSEIVKTKQLFGLSPEQVDIIFFTVISENRNKQRIVWLGSGRTGKHRR